MFKLTMHCTDMGQMPEPNENYPKHSDQLPTREAIGVVTLPLDASLEIVAVAEA